ncbi:hypothetical protein VQ02_07030 [Methylobacterium variabile]|uniref:Multicopper oxidase n=1 Tax=Methylobacterium variabile TaxID=298794 RepID=A0A0J6T4B8_9HYPH|nr:hypothetical protein [Methylobacterium variabile]KMO40809.1 hypothetical protein VQ02_07030 [Methylobacterium variabile]
MLSPRPHDSLTVRARGSGPAAGGQPSALARCVAALALLIGGGIAAAAAQGTARETDREAVQAAARVAAGDAVAAAPRRIVHADVVALDQLIVYNRFGSFNPYGMVFALRRDVSALGPGTATDADQCRDRDGTEAGEGALTPGAVRLKDCKRARPLTLRANVGDILEIKLTNLLRPAQPGISETWCGNRQSDDGTRPTRRDERTAFEAQCREADRIERQANAEERAAAAEERRGDWPATRGLSLSIPGLEPLPVGETVPDACLGLASVPPGRSFVCRFRLEREGTHLLSSLAAPAGGEGDAGSATHGLFGALIVEPPGARALRSQVSSAAFDKVWPGKAGQGAVAIRHARSGAPDYAAASGAPGSRDARPDAHPCGTAPVPVLEVVRPCPGRETVDGIAYARAELVHGDLNAVIVPDPGRALPPINPALTGEDRRTAIRLDQEARAPFREFTVVFHDELKTYYADPQRELSQFGQLSAARDGFAINYGSSGAGAMVLANRKGIGPTANCPECLYEEFFLESWANGDPALLENYPDDPSNVHHSYLNDKVVFRNLHIGKETHVFHLHSHQWFAGNDENRGAYLDSQTIAPQQGFTYRIYHGGLDRYRDERAPAGARGWWEAAKGSGNRNRTVGDAIFHCHLYPHFAQGMWALWRVHDVMEDGTRVLPDGQKQPGLSVLPNTARTERREGSVALRGGQWLGTGKDRGTPVPGVVPVPGEAAPLLPVYTAPETVAEAADGMPGYPFFIAGEPGHRAPQPPLDMARDLAEGAEGRLLDGGLPRHVITGGLSLPSVLTAAEKQAARSDPSVLAGLAPTLVPRMLALGDATSDYERLDLKVLPHAGTRLEQNAMGFHHDGKRPGGGALPLRNAAGDPVGPQTLGSYPSLRLPPLGGAARLDPAGFAVNGAPPVPGAPYADPCGAASTLAASPFRRFVGFRAGAAERDRFEDAVLTRKADPAVAGDGLLRALRGNLDFVPDPGLLGFRRYDVSAIQFDMTVNRAGWHDPQARIAVLTAEADAWKESRSARAEPFFFRGFSGECIELRHTNELPKDLELDDFQLRVPTDTIGQHIHLVKFDVTSADGSGNGFNYEDGTFAPDEILARICAARKPEGSIAGEAAGVAPRGSECADLAAAKAALEDAVARNDAGAMAEARRQLRAAQLWWRKGAGNRRTYFQTTVQRWFADPILSNTGDGKAADRTLRTVFTHDHFGPSNIQQHGYYAALLIEPNTHGVERYAGPEQARADMPDRVPPPEWPAAGEPVTPRLIEGGRGLVGARAVVEAVTDRNRVGDPIHPNTREFALAIADFALLYDGAKQPPQDFDAESAAAQRTPKGMARLVAEARCEVKDLADAARQDPDIEPGESIPARRAGLCVTAAGQIPVDEPASAAEDAARKPEHAGQVTALATHAAAWREAHGRPVAAPPRPESFSQKHHDPYLVNYRNEPVPLRVGARDASGDKFAFADNPCSLAGSGGVGPAGENEAGRQHQRNHDDVRAQRRGEAGDLANVFRSAWTRRDAARDRETTEGHGDPCTPVIEAYARERLLLRMVQGAQEVQHTFHIEGVAFRRNADQAYPTARAHLGRLATALRPRNEHCHDDRDARDGRPRDLTGLVDRTGPAAGFWTTFERLIGGCDNLLGVTSAQEIGLSEHFEIGGRLSATAPGYADLPGTGLAARRPGDGGPRGAAVAATASYADSSGRLRAPRAALGDAPPGRPWAGDRLRNQSVTGPSLNLDTFRKQIDLEKAGLKERDLRQALDYMYSFGSADAIWNGAWGLVRIYDRPGSFDLARCLRDPTARDCLTGDRPAARERFRPVRTDGVAARPDAPALESAAPEEDEAPPRVATAQALVCPAGAQTVETIMVAVRADEILDGPIRGLPYDGRTGLSDPDGLMIVSLPFDDLRRIVPPDPATGPREVRTFYDVLQAQALPRREDIVAMLKQRYAGVDRPEPYVLRVNAGDCVSAVMINALQQGSGTAPVGMRDLPGDALMPKIVPLNTDPHQLGGSGRDLWPSTRVTFTLPAAVTSPRNGVPFPFGVNQTSPLLTEAEARELERSDPAPCSLGAGRCLPDRSWTTVTFYAGALSVDARALQRLLPWQLPADSRLSAIRIETRPRAGCGPDRVEFAFLTVLLCAANGRTALDFSATATGSEADNADEVAKRLADYLGERQGEFLSAIPYAAGALPIRVAGDLIGHASHGLSGMLIVEPQGATYPGRPEGSDPIHVVSRTRSQGGEPIRVAPLRLCPPGAADRGGACPVRIPEAAIREHALMVQDGLNLWSRRWAGPGPRPVPVTVDGHPGHPLPNCPVCDDSYDLGEKGVSYRTAPFARRLGGALGLRTYPDDRTNLNAVVFPRTFFSPTHAPVPTPTLDARAGEEMMIRLAHPAGRARHRAFVTLGASYDDLLPGFGTGHSGHLAPGKAFTASLCASRQPGTYLYRDGPQAIFAAGAWGHVAVTPAAADAPSCRP